MFRLIESIVCFQVTGFADVSDIFYKHQYGFRAKPSIFQALNEGKINVTLFINLKRAFDTVNYEILLLNTEKHYGISKNLLFWFKNYLKNTDSNMFICLLFQVHQM